MANRGLAGILEKMIGKDENDRYKATLDLLNELNMEEFKVDSELEIRLSNIILQQLDDSVRDVSELALKCLAPLVKKVSVARLLQITKKLCDKLLYGEEQNLDVVGMALKTITSQVTNRAAVQIVVPTLTCKLIKGIRSGMTTEIKCASLGLLCDVLPKYGSFMDRIHRRLLLDVLLSELDSSQASAGMRVISCIASLASSLSDEILEEAIVRVVRRLKLKSMKLEIRRRYIQMIGSLSLAVRYRFEPYLGDTVPLLMSYCMSTKGIDEELREYSLQALESILLGCPRDISFHCDQILHLTLALLSYDPNITDGMEEDTNDESDVEDEDDERADEYIDDEDASWKVRRAAAKCLAAFIVSQPQMLQKLYEEACPKLIDRFKEREENVKMDVFSTFIELLCQTGNVTRGHMDTDELSPRWLLKQEVPKVVKAINKKLHEKSVKTKAGAFAVLKELVVVLPDCLTDQIGSLVRGIGKALLDKSSTSNLKIEALVFTRLVLASHSPAVFHPHIKAISGPILSAVGERYYKVSAEAIRVCGELVRILRPSTEVTSFDFKEYVHLICNAIMARLTNQDQDQEVKECAISCMGLLISTFGDNISAELPACLQVLVDCMVDEITRLTTLKAFSNIAASPLHVDLSCVLENVIAELTAFLQKANGALRQATLGTLSSIIVTYGDKISSSAYEVIIVELSSLISDSDLHTTALALEFCCTLMSDRKSNPDHVCLTVREKVLPQALALMRSSLLQGRALMALQSFFTSLVDSANSSFESLLDSLLSFAKTPPQNNSVIIRQALFSIARCIAVLCLAAGDQKCSSSVKMLTGIIKGDGINNSAEQQLALFCLCEIGRRKNLSEHAHIENIVIDSFQSPSKEIKSAASYALGNIAVGNLSKYLPFVLDQIDNQQNNRFLLLHSLKAVIVRQSVDKTEFQKSSVDKILSLLFNHCESEEEGVRNVVAECLGKIALIEPAKLVPELKARISSPVAFTRATVVAAITYSLVKGPEKIDEILYPEISSFLMLIKDHEPHVRRAAVLALSAAARNKPNLIKGLLLPELLPLLYDQTVIKLCTERVDTDSQIRPLYKDVVEDDGLELRKAAFECVDTLLDTCLDQVHPSSFIVPHLMSGLDDHDDVKMLCHVILSKLADKCPCAVLEVIDCLGDPLERTVVFNKPNQVDGNEDVIRSAYRAAASLDRISVGDCTNLTSFRFKYDLMRDHLIVRDAFAAVRSYHTVRDEGIAGYDEGASIRKERLAKVVRQLDMGVSILSEAFEKDVQELLLCWELE